MRRQGIPITPMLRVCCTTTVHRAQTEGAVSLAPELLRPCSPVRAVARTRPAEQTAYFGLKLPLEPRLMVIGIWLRVDSPQRMNLLRVMLA